MKNLAVCFIIFVLICLNVYQCNSGYQEEREYGNVVTDTITYIDTVTYYKPIPRDSVVIKYVVEKLPIADNGESTTKEPTPSSPSDSVSVVMPITQKEYKGEDYHAWVSGYRPHLDSLLIYPKTHVITIRERKRWSFGVSAGYGATPRGFQPYVGVSLNYNLLN